MEENTFKAYDIRGDYPGQINEELAYKLGKAFVVFLKTNKVIVGRDCRNGSKELSAELMRGITEQGADAIDLGLCSTPLANFASKNCDVIMVTASHLPAQKNGFKLYKQGVTPISGNNGLQKIQKLIKNNKFPKAKKQGTITQQDLIPAYANNLMKFAKNLKKLKIVIDAGNGMAGYIAPAILQKIPCETTKLYFELNGNFPNRSPNPLEENSLKALSEKIKETKADLGAAYDSDCDRIVFADEKGQIIDTDIALVILAKQFIQNKKETIIYDCTCSKIVPEKLIELGAKPLASRVGRTFIQQEMKRTNAVFGGEKSAHYFFKDENYSDSGDAALLTMLSILSQTDKKLSQIAGPLKKYFNRQEYIRTNKKEEFMKKLKQEYKRAKQTKIDGITFEFSDWWFNARLSNTEQAVKITIETQNKTLLEQKTKEILSLANQHKFT